MVCGSSFGDELIVFDRVREFELRASWELGDELSGDGVELLELALPDDDDLPAVLLEGSGGVSVALDVSLELVFPVGDVGLG